ncbi:hypothetical protein D9M69_716190 [compost metagenome]
MTIDIDALPFIRTRIAAIPCAHQHCIEIPALRADMRPVTAKAGAGYFEITHGKIIPAERLTSPIGVPSSACFKTNAICASENFDAFTEISFSQIRDHKWEIPVLNGLI